MLPVVTISCCYVSYANRVSQKLFATEKFSTFRGCFSRDGISFVLIAQHNLDADSSPDPDSSLPACDVILTQRLDLGKFDLSSIRFLFPSIFFFVLFLLSAAVFASDGAGIPAIGLSITGETDISATSSMGETVVRVDHGGG